MPLVIGSITKLGFGLWRSAIGAYIVEEILLLTGLVIYLRATKPVNRLGKYSMTAFIILLLLINIVNIFGPLSSENQTTLAISAPLSYFLSAMSAFWLDGKRT